MAKRCRRRRPPAQAMHTASPQHTHPASATTQGHQNPTPRSAHAPQGGDCVRRPGGHGGGTPPDPIPNSDVKTTSAYDTAPQGAGKSVAARSSDAIIHTPTNTKTNTQRTTPTPHQTHHIAAPNTQDAATTAGWSSPVARQAHNLKVTGSNPVPATPSATPSALIQQKPRQT